MQTGFSLKRLALALVFTLAFTTALGVSPAAAVLDCTPFQSWTCTQQGYYGALNGFPGEVVCGTDYTGWTFHIIEVTVTQAGFFAFQGVSAAAALNIVDSAIILLDDCATGTCVDSTQGFGLITHYACLDVGTHKFLFASNTTAPTAFMNIGFSCLTCDDADTIGYQCVHCGVVADQHENWGSVKALFK